MTSAVAAGVVLVGTLTALWAADRYGDRTTTLADSAAMVGGGVWWIAGVSLVIGGYTYLGAALVVIGGIIARSRARQVRESDEARDLWRRING